MLFIFSSIVFGVGVMIAAAKIKPAPGNSVAGRVFAIVLKSGVTLFGALVAFLSFGAMISTGVGLAVLVTAILLIPVYVLEDGFGFRPGIMRIVRIALFPLVMVTAILFTVYQASLQKYVIPTSEYSESSAKYRSIYENEPEPPIFAETAELRLREGFPRIEGSTSLGGLFTSIAQATYGGGNARQYAVASKTPNAYASLIAGRCDIVFAFHPSREEMAAAEAAGTPFILTPVGREAFVFIVNAKNPVDDLSVEQLRAIYAGRVANWREVGGGNEKIVAYQRSKNSGSQSRMERFMAGDVLATPPNEYEIWDMVAVISYVARYHNLENAIGYSFRFFVQDMIGNNAVKMLRVNGVAPGLATIRDGSYPLLDDIYAVTTGKSHPNSAKVIEWLCSPQGQRLVLANKYAPLMDTE